MTRVACIQMNSSADLSENLFHAQQLIQEAAEKEARLIVLPEMFSQMGIDEKLKHKEQWGKGPVQDFLSEKAREYGIWLVGGTIPIVASKSQKVFSSCIVYDDQGASVGRYDKMHLFDVYLHEIEEKYAESENILAGNQIVVIETPFGNLGLAVCYDIRFPELFRHMLEKNVEIIALPAAFTYTTGAAHWDILLRARAIENLAYVLAACQTGTHANKRKTYGNSMVVNPWGEIQVCLPENSGIIIAEINLDFQKKIRKEFPVLSHRLL